MIDGVDVRLGCVDRVQPPSLPPLVGEAIVFMISQDQKRAKPCRMRP